MDRLDAMRVFVAVADLGGFAAGARHLGVSAPAATRAVAALEARIGAPLLRRTTRTVRLTEAGARYAADCRRILGEVGEAEASAAGDHAEPRGTLGVTAPVLFGRRFVAPTILDFLRRYPAVSVNAFYADRVVDILEEGFDVAVRIAELSDSSLRAIRVGRVWRLVCAAPALLERHGAPERLEDLRALPAIGISAGGLSPEWELGRGGARPRAHPRVQLTVNQIDVAIAAAMAGHGYVRVLSYQVADELATGRLVVLLPDHGPPPVPVHVVHADGRRTSARLRALIDVAVERLRADPAVNPPGAGTGGFPPAAESGM